MMDFVMVALGCIHFAALVGAIVIYLRHIKMPRNEMPLLVFLMLWAALIAAGYIASSFNALGNLAAYAAASFVGVAIVIGLHRLVFAPARKTPFSTPVLPDFMLVRSPRVRQYLWIFLLATLAISFLVHLVIAASFYPCNGDSMIYRLPRAFWYVSSGNLLHPFVSADKRITYYPLNGIMLYIPLVLYRLPGTFHSIPSLFSWLAVAYASYRFPRSLGADRLISLFTTWLVALTPSILVQATSTNDEILAGAAMLTALYFAWRWLVSGEEHYLFLAALGIGVSAGTKPHMLYLTPLTLFALGWFAWFLLKRRQSPLQWLPRVGARTLIISIGVLLPLALLFLLVNYMSEGRFFYFDEYGPQVFNLKGFAHLIGQNLLLFFTQLFLAPLATLDVWTGPAGRAVFENDLNKLLSPMIAPLMSNDPKFYHMNYRFQGVIIPTTILLVEFSLWPGFVWLLWPLQWLGLARQKFTLRPLFVLLAVVPVVWLVTWSCVMLYMEGAATYLAFFLMISAPAMMFCFVRAPGKRFERVRWILLAIVMTMNLVINTNVFVNNIFRGFRELAESPSWPDDWLRFELPAIMELKRAENIQILAMHTLTYFFSFMHWNPNAHYFSPYNAPAVTPEQEATFLQVTSLASEYKFGFIPMWIPGKPTPGMTYLGDIRGADAEPVFGRGDGVEKRWPGRANFIVLTVKYGAVGDHYEIGFQGEVAGLNPEDNMEFAYQVKTSDGAIVYDRPWNKDPHFAASVPHDPAKTHYFLTVSTRSATDKHIYTVVKGYPIEGADAWQITGYKGDHIISSLPLAMPGLTTVPYP